MLLDHGAAIRGIHEELALLRKLLTGRLPPPRASLLASSATVVRCRLQDHSQWRRRRRCLPDRCLRQCGCWLQHVAFWCAGGWVGYLICS
jgi:hypothetical protein